MPLRSSAVPAHESVHSHFLIQETFVWSFIAGRHSANVNVAFQCMPAHQHPALSVCNCCQIKPPLVHSLVLISMTLVNCSLSIILKSNLRNATSLAPAPAAAAAAATPAAPPAPAAAPAGAASPPPAPTAAAKAGNRGKSGAASLTAGQGADQPARTSTAVAEPLPSNILVPPVLNVKLTGLLGLEYDLSAIAGVTEQAANGCVHPLSIFWHYLMHHQHAPGSSTRCTTQHS